MKIHLQNYEEYFVRYLDGELTPDEVTEVQDFLMAHPELNRELEAFRQMILPATDEISFPGKDALKKGITAANSDEYLVRKIEGDLSAAEEKELNDFLRFNPEFQKTLGYFEATKLTADTTVFFPNKRSLKKSTGRTIPIGFRYLMATAVAASLVAVLLIRGVQWNITGESTPVAQQKDQRQNISTPDIASDHENQVAMSTPDAGQKETEASERKTVNHEKKISPKKRESAPALLAQVPETGSQVADNQPQQMQADELHPISNGGATPIYYQARQKKVLYKDVAAPQPVVASRTTSGSSPIGTLAAGLATDLLKWSGRGDYLPESTTTASAEKNKEPLALNLDADRFGFNTTLFKKRAEKNSSTN